MKQCKVVLSLMIVAAVLFASVLPVSAITFVAEEKYESVVVIRSGDALGSGFAVGSNCIVTNAHVIQDPDDVTVWSYSGRAYSAQVIGMDEDQDIAVLAVADGDFPALAIGDMDAMRTGDDVYAIGAPKNMTYTLTKGVVSARERRVGFYTYIQTDAPINEGNSGGPLLNASGEVIGMNTLKMNDSEGIGLAIPITRICDFLTGLGIELDASGNVTETIDATIPQEQPRQEPTENHGFYEPEEPPAEETSGTPVLPWVIAGISVLLNVILVIALVYEKQRNITMAYDPRERTDFDIDIFE